VGKRERNYGIDLLRIIATFMICLYHVLGYGGMMYATDYLSGHWVASWSLEKLTHCCVNCYALVSGYLGVDSKPRLSKYLGQWLQVVFYSVGIMLVFKLLYPATVTPKQLASSFFPVMTSKYWYFSAYTGVFLLMPLFNHIVNTMDQKTLGGTLLLAATVMTLPVAVCDTDPFAFYGGYTTMWLALLYLIGAWVRRRGGSRLKTGAWLLIYFASCFVTLAVKMVSDYTFLHYNFRVMKGLHSAFTSPLVLLGAYALLQAFSTIRLHNARLQKAVAAIATASFGVYLIHVHPCIWEHWMPGAFKWVAKLPLVLMLATAIASAAALMTVCLLVEGMRIRLFGLLHIPRLAQLLGDRVEFSAKKAYTRFNT